MCFLTIECVLFCRMCSTYITSTYMRTNAQVYECLKRAPWNLVAGVCGWGFGKGWVREGGCARMRLQGRGKTPTEEKEGEEERGWHRPLLTLV